MSRIATLGFAAGSLVIACDSSGTDAGSNGDPGEVGVFVQPADATVPGLSVSITPPAPSVCAGQCVRLLAQAAGGTAPYSFAWSPGGESEGGSVLACPSTTTSYQVTATDGTGRTGEIASAGARASSSAVVTVGDTCSDAGVLEDGGDSVGRCEVVEADTFPVVSDAGDPYQACDAGSTPTSEELDFTLKTPIRAGQEYEVSFAAEDFAFGTPLDIDVLGATRTCDPGSSTRQAFGSITVQPTTVNYEQSVCFRANADYPYMVLVEHLGGLDIGITTSLVIQMCGGCGASDAGAE